MLEGVGVDEMVNIMREVLLVLAEVVGVDTMMNITTGVKSSVANKMTFRDMVTKLKCMIYTL